jgi:phosphoribosyl-AMP cyclohydrolase
MDLPCEKYKKTMAAKGARCQHPTEYCKFRNSCMIHFLSKENGAGCEGKDEEIVGEGRNTMVKLRFDKGNGLLPAVVQDHESREVLMVAYVNEEALAKTLETGTAHYWSRSRNELWLKGGTSGHVQNVKEVLVDCDEDCIIYVVQQEGGAACHTGYRSCFYRKIEGDSLKVTGEPVFDPKEVYGK